MAGLQELQKVAHPKGIEDWMERRRRDVAASWRSPAEILSHQRPLQPITLPRTPGPGAPSRTAHQSPFQDPELVELRREQAAFKDVVRAESRRNSWMAIPALAPITVPLLAEGVSLLTGRLAASQLKRLATNQLSQEAASVPSPLTEIERNVVRAAARKRIAQANGTPASKIDGEVHHRVALRFAHLFPNADPNRLANLIPLMREAHLIASRSEADFVRALAGRIPTQAEIVAQAMRLDKLIEPYVLRVGVSRPPPLPRK
jgi:hypothetical protein